MKILAVDPGVTTGYVIVEYLGADHITLLKAGVLKGVRVCVETLLREPDIDVYVCEDFKLATVMAKEVSVNDPYLHSAQIIGALKCMVKKHQFVLQGPSERASKDALQKLFGDVKNRHVKDALRHAITYILRDLHQPIVNNGPTIKVMFPS